MIGQSFRVLFTPSWYAFDESQKDSWKSAIWFMVFSYLTQGLLLGLGTGTFDAFFAPIIGGLFAFPIYVGLIYGCAKAFKGTGASGVLAYNLALVYGLLGIIETFFVALIPSITFVAILIGLYGLYPTNLAIQAAMNVSWKKALLSMFLPALFAILLAACMVGILTLLADKTVPVFNQINSGLQP